MATLHRSGGRCQPGRVARPAGAPPRKDCGHVLTRSTALGHDIGPCAGDGIVIGADDITLNLNGHKVLGSPETGASAGIRIAGRSGVTITGAVGKGRPRGVVTGFDAGVAIIGGSKNTVTNLVVEDNVGPENPDTAIFGDGIGVFFSPENRIVGNTVAGNGVYDGIGVFGFGSDRNVVQDNVVSATDDRGQGSSAAVGIGVIVNAFLSETLPRELNVYGNRIVDNVIRDSDNSGISTIGNVDGVVTGNLVEGNGTDRGAYPGNGIGVQALQNGQQALNALVKANRVLGNGSGPAFFGSGDGINVQIGEQVHVLANEVHGNWGSGIFVGQQAHRNEIRDNDAADNALEEPNIVRADLRDSNFTRATRTFDCDSNTWFGNVWGTGGYLPDPERDGSPLACTTIGGHAAGGSAATLAGAGAPTVVQAAPDDTRLRRGHPAEPR